VVIIQVQIELNFWLGEIWQLWFLLAVWTE